MLFPHVHIQESTATPTPSHHKHGPAKRLRTIRTTSLPQHSRCWVQAAAQHSHPAPVTKLMTSAQLAQSTPIKNQASPPRLSSLTHYCPIWDRNGSGGAHRSKTQGSDCSALLPDNKTPLLQGATMAEEDACNCSSGSQDQDCMVLSCLPPCQPSLSLTLVFLFLLLLLSLSTISLTQVARHTSISKCDISLSLSRTPSASPVSLSLSLSLLLSVFLSFFLFVWFLSLSLSFSLFPHFLLVSLRPRSLDWVFLCDTLNVQCFKALPETPPTRSSISSTGRLATPIPSTGRLATLPDSLRSK